MKCLLYNIVDRCIQVLSTAVFYSTNMVQFAHSDSQLKAYWDRYMHIATIISANESMNHKLYDHVLSKSSCLLPTLHQNPGTRGETCYNVQLTYIISTI